jgi:prolyl 4-hydroxylase
MQLLLSHQQQPEIHVLGNFLSEEEADALVALSQGKMKPATVVDNQTGEYVPHPERRSDFCFFERGETSVIAALEQRIEALTHIPASYGEGIQVIRYGVGGEYKPHHDYFDPIHPSGQMQVSQHGQRQVTLIMYLNTPEQGGETIFPKVNLEVKPVKGNAVLFFNLNHAGQLEPQSLHGGTPVLAGTKWIATKWIRTQPYCHS